MNMKSGLARLLLATTSFSTAALAAETQLFWGDTHLHTSYSADAFMMGNRDTDPDTAYRVAKGEPVIHPFNRTRVQLRRPLDFLVVADHAEGLGLLGQIYAEDPDLSGSWFWQRWISAFFLDRLRSAMENPEDAVANFTSRMPDGKIAPAGTEGTLDPVAANASEERIGPISRIVPPAIRQAISASMWQKSVAAAEAHYEPGVFTPIIGWEWTQAANGVSLHRVVMSTLDGTTAAGIGPVGKDNAPYPRA